MTTTPIVSSPVKRFIDDPEKVVADLTVNDVDLNGELVRHAANFYRYAYMYAQAERQTADIKVRLEAKEALVADKIRADAKESGEKITESAVTEKVKTTPAVLRLRLSLNEAKEVERDLSLIIDAMRQKKDTLVTRCHVSRDEIKANLAVAMEARASDPRKGSLASLRS